MLKVCLLISFLTFQLLIGSTHVLGQEETFDNFENGVAEGWILEPGWQLKKDERNIVLSGEGHSWARLQGGEKWTDYSYRLRLKLIRGGIHLNYHVSDDGRYFIGLREHGLYLNKETPWGKFFELAASDTRITFNVWHDIEIRGEGGHIQVYVDGSLEIDVIDDTPLTQGGIAFETLEESNAYVDDIVILSSSPEPDRPSSPAKKYPVVKVTKSMGTLGPDKTGIDVLESATITIKLDGDSMKNPKGLSVVLILDESGSMDNLAKHSRAAAKAVVGLLDPSDKVALITFSTNATLVSGLTMQHQKVISAINNLSDPDGKTNVKQAFDLANTTLKNDKSAIKKVVFLLTDGMPTPITQADQLRKGIPSLNASNINYFTAGYGNFTKTWLMELAEDTGGTFCDPTSPSYIKTCFQKFWQQASKLAHAQQVTINEVLSSHFSVVSGTFSHSTSLKSMPKYLKDALIKAEANFYATGVLKTPPIYELPTGQHFSVSFDVSPKTCKPKKTNLPVNDITKTYLEYRYGAKVLTITHPQFNQVSVPVNPCGVYVEKKFEMANRIVRIAIRNTFQDRNVNDIHVVEIQGDYVTPIPASAKPFKYGTLGQVLWPHYPATSYMTPDGVEWRFFDGLPTTAATIKLYPPYGYTVQSHGYIKANTKLELSLPINAKASAKDRSPVVINKEGIKGPDVTVVGGSITFWYYYDKFADTKIKSEQIGGYTYKYYYEDLPYGFSQKWGNKRHVVINLPKLEVVSLPPEWPVYK